MAGWLTNIIIPYQAERNAKVKPCRTCGSPIRLISSRESGRVSIVDAVPRTDGWTIMYKDGYGPWVPDPDERKTAKQSPDVVAPFRAHVCVAESVSRTRWERLEQMQGGRYEN